MRRLANLWVNDLQQSWRDFITLMVFLLPIIIGLLMRFVLPLLFQFIPASINLELYLQLGVAILILFPSLLSGMIAAFLMLDEKDEGTLLAIQVTPMPRTYYAVYRLFFPVILSVVLVIAMIIISDLMLVSFVKLFFAALLAALTSPIWAFVIFLLSGNKIEGLAIVKLLNLFVGLPLLAEVIPHKLTWLLWPLPLFWPYKFMLEAIRGASPLALAGFWVMGVAIHAAYLILLLRYISRQTL